MNTYKAIGLMSGSSLDGLDIAYCQFEYENGKWTYQIIEADCVPYPQKWKLRLKKLNLQNAMTYVKTHTFYGHFLGEMVGEFCERHNINKDEVDLVASHGHTVFHDPRNRLSSQIGDGAAIASRTGMTVITNLRNSDVAAGGEGAPIVPIGDKYLFGEHLFCLNLGGIANISCKLENGDILGYDITACNLILNALAQVIGTEYDDGGRFAASGHVEHDLLADLNNMPFYKKNYPKSLNNGWAYWTLNNVINKYRIRPTDKLRTFCEHIVVQIAKEVNNLHNNEDISTTANPSMLITGGGAHNAFLIKCLSAVSPVEIVIPDTKTIEFKEAMMMAFIGVLRLRNEVNCLSATTGATKDTIGGAIYHGN